MSENHDLQTFTVPAGSVRHASVYRGLEHHEPKARYGLGIDADVVPAPLLEGVRVREVGGDAARVVQFTSRHRVPVSVEGFGDDIVAGWDWLEGQFRVLDLGNRGRDAVFTGHPLRVAAYRYRYRAPRSGIEGYALALEHVAIIARRTKP